MINPLGIRNYIDSLVKKRIQVYYIHLFSAYYLLQIGCKTVCIMQIVQAVVCYIIVMPSLFCMLNSAIVASIYIMKSRTSERES